MMRNRIVIAVTALSMFMAASIVQVWAAMPQVGQQAPKFSLMSHEGHEVKLDDFQGKWVVLYFYPKDFTSGCTLEAHNFQRDLASYEKANAVILGVSVDGVDSHKSFCEKEGLQFKLLADTDHKVSDLYGSLREFQGNAVAARNTFIVDPSGKIAKVFEGVKPPNHSEEVLAALADLK
jgi:thioredoxin-dependent peroxiredoxin